MRWLVAVLVVFAGCAAPLEAPDQSAGAGGDESDTAAAVYQSGHKLEGSTAPAYEAARLNGESLPLPADGVVLVTTWASWCSICKSNEPVWQSLHAEFANLTVYAVSRESSENAAQSYIDREEFSYPAFWDSGVNGALGMRDYQPNHMLIKDGEIVSVYEGSLHQRPGGEAGLRADVATLLA